ncbi:MAG: hypothetical protein WEB05_03150, partial [Solirubrobacterales bacterium]
MRKFRSDGCTIIGMTGMPEAVLAREAGLEYAAICPVANLAAGLAPVELTADEVFSAVAAMLAPIQSVVSSLAAGRAGLDIYLPEGPSTGPRPFVLHIHGGGWRIGDKANASMPDKAALSNGQCRSALYRAIRSGPPPDPRG